MEGAAPWVLDPWSLIRDEGLSHRARLVLFALCRVAHDDGTARGGEWLSTWTGLSRQRITEAVRELEEKGLIKVNRQRRKANIYMLIPTASTTSGHSNGPKGGVGSDRIAVIKNLREAVSE
jgi:biotin operon repressor